MRRQLYRGGGITGLYPRQKYGIGSWVKERVRKLIPNELADVATKAAPFVAPFNPGIAALMRGVGRFDQRGSISDALKQGALTYGGGQLARQLGGAGVQTDFLGTPGDRFTTPLSSDRMEGLRNLFKGREKAPVKEVQKSVQKGVYDPTTMIPQLGSEQPLIDKIMTTWKGMSPGLRTAIVGTGSGAIAGVAQWFENQVPQEQGESIKEWEARRNVVVGKLMRQYLDNTRSFDAEWTAKTDEQKTDYISSINMNQGGRVGYQAGSLVDPRMQRSLTQNVQELVTEPRAANQLVANASALASKIGTGIKSLPEKAVSSVFGKHFDNTQNLRNALSNKMITEDQYKKMSGYDASREIAGLQGINPGMTVFNNALASGLYNAYKKYRNFKDPSNPDAQYSEDFGPIKSIIANTQGSIGLPEDQLALYNKIIGGQTQQSELDRFKTAWDMANYGMPSEQVNWTTTARPDYERNLREYQTWNKGPWSSDPSITSKMTSSFGHAPGYMLASGGRVGLYGGGEPEAGIKSLEAGAPDITYEGNEGPQAPMKMAGNQSDADEHSFRLFNKPFKNLSPMELDEFWEEMERLKNKFTGPVIPSNEDPINPFAPKPTGPVLPDKMMAAKGGRIKYNLGTDPRALMGAPGLAGMQSAPRPAMDPRGLRGLPGIPRMAPDGMEFDMRQNGGFQGLGAKEKKDDVPAMLAKNEFVFTADAVRGAGGGDIELGAQRMYDTMKNLEKRVV
jgi:hypothetical protein